MTGDDWKRVKAIALDASTRPEPGRVSYVTQACAGDADLQREVLSLLGAMAAAEDGSDMPPWLADPLHEAAAFAALIGRRLGAYEILSRVGAGGMGEIYKARDTRLDRIVAIKVLPARASADPVSRERIAREQEGQNGAA